MSKGWESPSSQSVELVLEEHDLFFLLLDHIQQFSLVGDVFALLLGHLLAAGVCVGLKTVNLLSLLNIVFEHPSLLLELLVLGDLLADLLLQLGDHVLNSSSSLGAVLTKLGGLGVEALLVVFFLLHVLALDNLLGLLGDTVELNIHSTLGKIDDLELQALVLQMHSLELSAVLHDVGHVGHFGVSTILNVLILLVNRLLQDKNGVLVISGNWELRYFNLTLLEVDNDFEVVLELLDAGKSFPLLVLHNVEGLLQLGHIHFIPLDEGLQVVDALVGLFFLFVHAESDVTLFDDLVELLLNDGWAWSITLEVVNFLLLHLLNKFIDSEVVNGGEGVQINDVVLHLNALL